MLEIWKKHLKVVKKFVLYILLSASYLLGNCQEGNSSSNFIFNYINKIINDTNDLSAPKFMNYPTRDVATETS